MEGASGDVAAVEWAAAAGGVAGLAARGALGRLHSAFVPDASCSLFFCRACQLLFLHASLLRLFCLLSCLLPAQPSRLTSHLHSSPIPARCAGCAPFHLPPPILWVGWLQRTHGWSSLMARGPLQLLEVCCSGSLVFLGFVLSYPAGAQSAPFMPLTTWLHTPGPRGVRGRDVTTTNKPV